MCLVRSMTDDFVVENHVQDSDKDLAEKEGEMWFSLLGLADFAHDYKGVPFSVVD